MNVIIKLEIISPIIPPFIFLLQAIQNKIYLMILIIYYQIHLIKVLLNIAFINIK